MICRNNLFCISFKEYLSGCQLIWPSPPRRRCDGSRRKKSTLTNVSDVPRPGPRGRPGFRRDPDVGDDSRRGVAPRRRISAEYPRGSCGGAATRPRTIRIYRLPETRQALSRGGETSRGRRRRDPGKTIRVSVRRRDSADTNGYKLDQRNTTQKRFTRSLHGRLPIPPRRPWLLLLRRRR